MQQHSENLTTFDTARIRARFPALALQPGGRTPIYLDNPGGTQVPAGVIDAMQRYLIEANSNSHGHFRTSQLTDAVIAEARQAVADFLNAEPYEIVFGPNMTTLTFSISRAIGRTLSPGDEIIVTRMDHDANISPWLLLARDYDLVVHWADFDPETGRLDLDGMGSLISPRTKVVACVYASNALGTINDVQRVVQMAHQVGALTYLDAVQYAPHGPIDVKALGTDFLACSAYKFFGPHVGVLYGRYDLLESLPAYKVRPAPNQAPDRWETGTQNHEGLAGTAAAVEHLAWVGEQFGADFAGVAAGYATARRRALKQAMHAIKRYEQSLSRRLLEGLAAIPGVDIAGITELDALDERVPTVIFRLQGWDPEDVASRLGEAGIYVWNGNYYALAVMETLGYEGRGGMVRAGAAHYNTVAEIDTFLEMLEHIARRR
ncbi:MAG: cysteine desulfurase-like protein [Anaerolineae bacterium]